MVETQIGTIIVENSMEVPQEIKVIDLVSKVGGRYERVNTDTGKFPC